MLYIYIILDFRHLDRTTTDEITLSFSDINPELVDKIEIALEFSNENSLSTKTTIEHYWR